MLFALMANAAAQAFTLVVLPPLGRSLSFTDIQTGALLGLSALVLLVAAPIGGNLSESFGRKPVLLVALAAAAAGPALSALVIGFRLNGAITAMTALGLLFGIRFLQSAFAAGLLPAAQAFMADSTKAEQRAEGMGLLGAAYGIGAVAGAACAFAIGGTAPVVAFTALSVTVAAGFLAVWTTLREPVPNRPAGMGKTPLSLPRLLPNLTVTFLAITVYGMVQHVTALRLQDGFGLDVASSISRAGVTLMGAALSMALVQAFALRWLRWPATRLMLAGAGVALVAMTVAAMAQSWPLLAAAVILFGAALGLLLPGNLASLSLAAGVQAQGRAAGINAVAQGLGMAAGPIAGAMLHGLAVTAPFLASCLLLAVVLAAPLLASPRRRQPA